MSYLYGSRPGAPKKLVATFDSEAQLLAYLRWATLSIRDGRCTFEKGSSLAGHQEYSYTGEPPVDGDVASADHNPSPNML